VGWGFLWSRTREGWVSGGESCARWGGGAGGKNRGIPAEDGNTSGGGYGGAGGWRVSGGGSAGGGGWARPGGGGGRWGGDGRSRRGMQGRGGGGGGGGGGRGKEGKTKIAYLVSFLASEGPRFNHAGGVDAGPRKNDKDPQNSTQQKRGCGRRGGAGRTALGIGCGCGGGVCGRDYDWSRSRDAVSGSVVERGYGRAETAGELIKKNYKF